jgi:hypothetical protein
MKWICLAVAAAALLPVARAQYAPAPDAYSLTGVNSMMGPPVTVKVWRDGMRAAVESSAPNVHTTSLYDLQAHSVLTWMPDNATAPCSKGTFGGDWGDPFALSAEVNSQVAEQHARQVGSEPVNGIAARVMEAASPDGSSAKAWIENKYGLVLKLVMSPKAGAPQTVVEVKSFTPGKPPAAALAPPASCAGVAAAPAPPTTQELIASETGGTAADYAQAMMPPASSNSCSVVLRVVRAGTMQPLTGGFQVAIDRTVDTQHAAHYVMGQAPGGRVTFSGGGLREETAQLRNGVLRIDGAPAQFDIEAAFGAGGAASALIYRQCYRPETVLLLVVKDPQKLSDGADWLWVKSGRFATVQP